VLEPVPVVRSRAVASDGPGPKTRPAPLVEGAGATLGGGSQNVSQVTKGRDLVGV